jgi:hypothetical protein
MVGGCFTDSDMMAPGRKKQSTRYKVPSAKYNRTSEARRRTPKWNVDQGRREHHPNFRSLWEFGFTWIREGEK